VSRPTLVLASTSPWRAELLGRLGLPFEQASPELDETPWMERGLPARELTVQLAVAKAAAVAARWPGALVLGADQVVSIDGRILGKPGTIERAAEQLELLSGRTHELVTGLALHDGRTGEVRTGIDVHEVTLRALDRTAIDRYVRREDVTGCAGSYKVEGLGIALFERVSGVDYTAVIGLPLTRVTALLALVGLDPLGS
jgi:septum formation protein